MYPSYLILLLLLRLRIIQIGPPVITVLIPGGSTTTYTLLPPSINIAHVGELSLNVLLQTNLIGKWRRPDNTEVTSDNITFPVFTAANHAGLYRFYVTNWEKVEVLAIQIILFTDSKFAHFLFYNTIELNLLNNLV